MDEDDVGVVTLVFRTLLFIGLAFTSLWAGYYYYDKHGLTSWTLFWWFLDGVFFFTLLNLAIFHYLEIRTRKEEEQENTDS